MSESASKNEPTLTTAVLWRRNLEAIKTRPPQELSGLQELLLLQPWPGPWVQARDGSLLAPVPEKQPLTACFSTYDRTKEAQRWLEGIPTSSLVLWGGPSPQAILGLLERSVPLIVIIEPRLAFWQATLSSADWSEILTHPSIFIPSTPQEFNHLLQTRHLPLWDRTLSVVEWRATADFERDAWNHAWQQVQDSWKGDLSTQARMGRLWLRQSLTNLARLKPFRLVWEPWDTVIIAGAGPGLESALESPSNRKLLFDRPANVKLFAVDTALPALICRGIEPDLIVSLDGQMVSYQHFLPAFPPHIPILADLASLPLLNRLTNPLLRFLSAQPLHRWIASRYPDLPQLLTPFGQVAGSALEAAYQWGAQKALLWGLDFAYPQAKTYARGTYIYPYFDQRANRLQPLDSNMVGFAFRTSSVQHWQTPQGLSYTNAVLQGYRTQLQTGVATWSMNFESWDGKGLPLQLPVTGRTSPHKGATFLSILTNPEQWKEFQRDLQRLWSSLPKPAPEQTWRTYAQTLSSAQVEAWLALWPLAAWSNGHTGSGPASLTSSWQEIFADSRQKALEILRDI
ncbi:MAG: DUF115 domain-containing protein [Spirochaetales bacterium]|nr:DUF115 domain-containing protein [Spirochaetales bacterium]